MMRNYSVENITEEQAEMVEKLFKDNNIKVSVTDNSYEESIRDIVHTQLENLADYLTDEGDNEKRIEILKSIDPEEMINHLFRGVAMDIFQKSESDVEDILYSIINEDPIPGYEDVLKN